MEANALEVLHKYAVLATVPCRSGFRHGVLHCPCWPGGVSTDCLSIRSCHNFHGRDTRLHVPVPLPPALNILVCRHTLTPWSNRSPNPTQYRYDVQVNPKTYLAAFSLFLRACDTTTPSWDAGLIEIRLGKSGDGTFTPYWGTTP